MPYSRRMALWPREIGELALTLSGCALALLFASTGCTTSRVAPASMPAHAAPYSEDEVAYLLRTEAQRWDGTPHRMGGTSRRGVDCSGFVMVLYDGLFGVPLPRQTDEQVHAGRPVRRNALQPGDLVFFLPSSKSRHVGIYLGGGEFTHASNSQGVMISHLDEPYWRDAYWTARRILRDFPAGAASREAEFSLKARTPEDRSESRKDGRRTGW